MKEFLVVVSFLVLVIEICALKLPNYMKICSISDEKFNDCVMKSANAAIKAIAIQGDPKYHVPSLNPLKLPEIMISTNQLMFQVKNVTVFGINESKIKSISFKYHPNNTVTVTAEVYTPKYEISGPYTTSGRILVLPINGNGHSNFSFYDNNATYEYSFDSVEKNGRKYGNIIDMRSQYKSKTARFYLGNLFNGNKALSDSMNEILNENWRDIYSELQGPISSIMESIIALLIRAITDRVPIDNLFIP